MHFLCNMRCFAQFFCARSLSRPARGGWIEICQRRDSQCQAMSRPARGGWIEIRRAARCAKARSRPAPQGAGGLKCLPPLREDGDERPAPQGAGGLKLKAILELIEKCGPAPQGAGGLKFCSVCAAPDPSGPAPQGASGLKSLRGGKESGCRGPAPQGAGSLSFGRFFPAMYGTEYRRRRIMRFGPRQGSAAVRSLTSCCARRPRSSS